MGSHCLATRPQLRLAALALMVEDLRSARLPARPSNARISAAPRHTGTQDPTEPHPPSARATRPPAASCGWDVLAAAPPALAIWAPRWAAANARRVLAALEAELSAAGDRPLVFFCFSGAIKVRGHVALC